MHCLVLDPGQSLAVWSRSLVGVQDVQEIFLPIASCVQELVFGNLATLQITPARISEIHYKHSSRILFQERKERGKEGSH